MKTHLRNTAPLPSCSLRAEAFRRRKNKALLLGAGSLLVYSYAESTAVRTTVDFVFDGLMPQAATTQPQPNVCNPTMKYDSSPPRNPDATPNYAKIAQLLSLPENKTVGGNWFLAGCSRPLAHEFVQTPRAEAVVQVDGVPRDCIAVGFTPKVDSDVDQSVLVAYCPPDPEDESFLP